MSQDTQADPELPEIPRISISQVLEKRVVISGATHRFVGKTISGDTFASFVESVKTTLPSSVSTRTARKSLTHALGTEWSDKNAEETAYRLAGNLKRLCAGEPCKPWSYQKDPEWCLAKCVGVKIGDQEHSFDYQIRFELLTGSPAPETVTHDLSRRALRYVATARNLKKQGFGFGRSRVNRRGEQTGKNLFHNARQLFGLYCVILLRPGGPGEDLKVQQISHTSSTTAVNAELHEGRDRLRSPCKKGYGKDQECYNCIVGVDYCDLAVRPTTFREGFCGECGLRKKLFDPEDTRKPAMCVNCRANQ